MAVGGHVYKAFMMCLQCGRRRLVVFTKRGLELFALSALKKGGRAAGRATVDGFNLINATPDESETHRLGKHKQTMKFWKHSRWVGQPRFKMLKVILKRQKRSLCGFQVSGVGGYCPESKFCQVL